MSLNSCHGNQREDFLMTFNFLRPSGVSLMLQNLMFTEHRVDKVVRGGGR